MSCLTLFTCIHTHKAQVCTHHSILQIHNKDIQSKVTFFDWDMPICSCDLYPSDSCATSLTHWVTSAVPVWHWITQRWPRFRRPSFLPHTQKSSFSLCAIQLHISDCLERERNFLYTQMTHSKLHYFILLSHWMQQPWCCANTLTH